MYIPKRPELPLRGAMLPDGPHTPQLTSGCASWAHRCPHPQSPCETEQHSASTSAGRNVLVAREPASLVNSRGLPTTDPAAFSQALQFGYRVANRGVALVCGSHSARLPPASTALAGTGATGGRCAGLTFRRSAGDALGAGTLLIRQLDRPRLLHCDVHPERTFSTPTGSHVN